MNIVMMTNTYAPHTGGVARSVEWFRDSLRQLGHRVLVVAPSFADTPDEEQDVIRVPAIQQFNGSDFSVRLPIPGLIRGTLEEFHPDVVHAHHPFLLGDTALRVAAHRDLPVVFTHHTLYEQYTHYVPGDSPTMQRFAIRLASEFANLCDHVIAPSESIANLIKERGVASDISVIPTGIDQQRFRDGDGQRARRRYDIPDQAFVVGHVGRLAPEKNLPFLARAVCRFLQSQLDARFLLVGTGPSLDEIRHIARECHVHDRLTHPDGVLKGQELADVYHAMDVFAFASHSETQGMVLAEAMTSDVPVVAVDAPGTREVVREKVNGRLLPKDDQHEFAEALDWCRNLASDERDRLFQAVRQTADRYAMSRCAKLLESVYTLVSSGQRSQQPRNTGDWTALSRLLGEEWNRLTGVATAVTDSLFPSKSDEV